MAGITAPRLKYRPYGKQLEAFGQSSGFMQIIRGPLGSGKTKATLFKLIRLLCEQRPDANGIRKSRIPVIRNTYPELVSTTIKEFQECVHPAMGKVVMGHPPVCNMAFALPDGTSVEAEIVFLALDREDDIRKLRGFQATFAWLSEGRFIPMAVVNEVLSRCDRFPQPGWSPYVGALMDTNAWDEDHPLEDMHQRALVGELKGWEFFIQPPAVIKAIEGEDGAHKSLSGSWWKVNPYAENLVVLRPQYYARQIAGNTDDWIRVNLANETGLAMDGKAVHPQYQESVHRSDKLLVPLPGIIVNVGMDFGLSPAAALAQRQPSGRWHFFDEVVCEDMGASNFADQLKLTCAEWKRQVPGLEFVFRGDPSGDQRVGTDEQTVFQVLRANGIPALPCSTNDPTVRRDALDRPLMRMVNGGPGILISPKCKVLRKGLKGGFQYKRVKVSGGDRYVDKPDKNRFSHVCEAAEYALMDAGEHAVVNSAQAKLFPRGPVQPVGAMSWDL